MRWRRMLLAFVALVAGAAGAATLLVRDRLHRSLPVLDGMAALPGLSSTVTVARDALGIPTIRGATRADLARALGFLHAQDRFFQMDLARRRAAGELGALVGARALPVDRRARLHRFRTEAAQAVALLAPDDRAVLDAYVSGVNQGLSTLGAVPFEYLLLRQAPEPWRAEDTFLVVLSMFILLQDDEGRYESTLGTMAAVLPAPMFEFLTSGSADWDAPIAGPPQAPLVPPGPEIYDLRRRRTGRPAIEIRPAPDVARASPAAWWTGATATTEPAIGSNSWAVSSRLTADGGALLASDIHLQVRVPNTWYRAVMERSDAGGTPERLMGLTLPGHPTLVAGSNGHVAWSFTNSYSDTGDVVLLDLEPGNPARYRTPDGWRTFETHAETIRATNAPDETVTVRWTTWGPVLPPDASGRVRAFRWAAHDATTLAASFLPLEASRTVEEAFAAANGLGVPAQNMIVAGNDGRIGWTIFGAIPRRRGGDGRLPSSWADPGRGWDGWLTDAEFPRVLAPDGDRIWSANQRMVDGPMLAVLGDGSYEVGSRARAIRDALLARDRFAPGDFLAIQLDARATFLARWRDLLRGVLMPAARVADPRRQALADVLDRDWDGTAAPGSAAYRFTRAFREEVSRLVMTFVLAECYERDPLLDVTTLRRREGPLWALVSTRPLHLLDPRFASWPDLFLAAADAVVAAAMAEGAGPLSDHRWSDYNVIAYRHPLSAAVPLSGRWLDMPARPLPGDLFTPRMHWGAQAASERMVVSPGREDRGIMHMPTGQSGHPLSPFYANSHDAWVKGDPTPFLPGQTRHTLTLAP